MFKKRALSALLALIMTAQLLPAAALADDGADETEEEIRQTLLDSVTEEEYPNGMFDFLTPRMETSEDVGEAEFAIVRRGNTDEAASVTFKAIDMTAEYGEDYTLEVDGVIFDKTLPKNEDSQPLIYEEGYTDEEEAEVTATASDEAAEETAEETDGELAAQESESDAETPAEEADVEETDEDTQAANGYTGTDLRGARTLLTGAESDTSTWRDEDEQNIEMLTEAYREMYDELEGVEYTFDFEPGEYMKKIRFVTVDDDISEDEEQVLFVLSRPENCEISQNPTGFMNIKDNEEPEEITYGFSESTVNVSKNDSTAELTIERLTGLYRYGTVTVSSAEYTAEEGVYYDGFSTEIAFVPGQEYKKISVPIKKHPAVEDVSFRVYIDDSDEYATINIEHGDIIGEDESGSDIVAAAGEEDADVELMSDNSSIWNRSENIKLTVSEKSTQGNPRTNYGWYSGDNRVSFGINGTGQDCWAKFNIDLSMVGKLDVTSEEFYEGTWYDNTYWFFGTHGSKGYYNDMWNYVKIGNEEKVSHYKKYSKTTDTITLNDSLRKAGNITFGTKVSGKCKTACGLFDDSVKVYYLPIEVRVGAYDDDAMIQKKIYTSQNNYTNNGDAFLAGKLKFTGQSADTTSKFFYNDDTVSFEETSRPSDETKKNGTYLWGIKFETKTGTSNKFFYYKGTSFSIKDLYNGNLKDINGKTIGETAKLTDNINGEGFTCYKIYPVYKQKTAFTTIKIDESKSQFSTNTFYNERTIKTGVLDQIQINIAGKNDYAVSGFNLGRGNRSAMRITTSDVERALYDETTDNANKVYKTYSPVYNKNSDWEKSIVNADVADPGSYLFSPTKNFNSLEALYQKPEITVAVNPRANSAAAQSKGFVAYSDEKSGGQVAKYTGTDSNGLLRGDTIEVMPYTVGEAYQFIGGFNDAAETGYKFQWQDFTGDVDNDGKLSNEEVKAMGNSYNSINKGVYAGDIFSFVPNVVGSPILYYNIVPKSVSDTSTKNTLSGNVLLKTATVVENSKIKPTSTTEPIANASVTAGGYTTQTDANGYWEIEASEFDVGETYTATLLYSGRSYTGDATVNRSAVDFTIDEYNTFNVKNFNAYRLTNDSEYENVEDWNFHSIANTGISNEDKKHLYTFEIDELNPTTAVVGNVEVERHSSDGTLKKTYTAVFNEENGVWEIKDPALITANKDDPSAYNYSYNPATENVAAGDYLTIRVYDQYDVGYIKHNVGITYKPKLSVVSIVNSFKSPLQPTLEFVGSVDSVFDLGLTSKIDTIDTKATDAVESKLDVTTTEEERIISFGWNKEIEKSYDSNDKDDKKDKKDPKSTEAPKTAAESMKDEASNLENVSDKTDDEKTEDEKAADDKLKDEAAETAKEAVDKDDDSNKKKNQFTAELNVELGVAAELVMGYDKTENRYYFKDFVVTGSISGDASAKYSYTTPIGIVIFVKGELSGDVTAILAIEPYYQNPAEPEYLYMDEAGAIDLTKLGNSDVNRQLSIYGKLMIRPKVSLSVGASLLSDKIASVYLTGAADFDMIFSTAAEGAGNVTLSADLTLEILGGLVKKKWLISKKKYDMFSINGGSLSELSEGEDYRYDVITADDTDQRLYLANRGDWNGDMSGEMSIMTTGTEIGEEHILQTGAYPHAYPQIITIAEGEAYDGSDSKQLLLFLDGDEDGVTLKYSIYSNGTWSDPLPIDNDDTNDDTPQYEEVGNKLLITWSSEDAGTDETDYIGRLNSRNIKSVFFDKETETFGDIKSVTQTTDEDKTADDYASASYYVDEDGKQSLVLSYIKSQYEQTGDELTAGDLLNAYSTVVYRFYDFDADEWVDSYSDETVEQLAAASVDVEAFSDNWYGQSFVDLSQYVYVDESDLKILPEDEELGGFAGLWSREPESSEISIESFSSDPMIIEHEALTSGKYSVSTYLVDLDRSDSTIDDRDIFMQLYDFEQEKFYPAVRLTNDEYSQSFLELLDAPDGVRLYYISNGNIVEQSIDDIIANLISTIDKDGNDVLVYNRLYSVCSGEEVIQEAEEDNPYSEFVVNSDETNVYITWTESGISFKEGIERDSDEATLPENYYAERQMYMAMETFDVYEYTYTDEDGNTLYYPETDEDGNTIDYNVVKDVNGDTGVVKAGDPMVEKIYNSTWTKPVQMTDEQGANYSDIDCVLIGNGVMRCVYLKGMSELTDVSGTEIPAENTDNRSLISADFDFNVERYTVSLEDIDDIDAGAEDTYVDVIVKNESILTNSDVSVALYMTQNGEESLIGEATIDEIIGGGTEAVAIPWDVPDELDGVVLTAKVNAGGETLCEASESLEYDGMIEITELSHEMLDRNTAEFTVGVKNTGSENAKAERVYVNCGGTVSMSDEFDLVSGEETYVTFNAEIPEEAFAESSTDTTITETAALRVYTSYSIEDYDIVRSASATLLELMNNVLSITDADGTTTYTDKLAMTVGDLLQLKSKAENTDEVNYPNMNITSDNDDIVSVTNNVLTAEGVGTAAITVELYPTADEYVTNDTDHMRKIDSYNTLPSSLIKTVTLTADVSEAASPSPTVALLSGNRGGSSGSDSASVTATATPAATAAPSETAAPGAAAEPAADTRLPFTDVAADDWFLESVRYVYENGLFSGVSDTLFEPNGAMTRAMLVTVLYRAEGEPDISYSDVGYPFADVDAEGWYGDAVYWARLNGIVKGYSDEEFGPNDVITREQIAAIMQRYADFKGIATDTRGDLTAFSDSGDVSDWALENVQWAVGTSLISGRDNNTLDPLGNATRAEVATILQRFIEGNK